MRFTEIDVLGVKVAPTSLMMVAAWVVTIALRRCREPMSDVQTKAKSTKTAELITLVTVALVERAVTSANKTIIK